MSSLPSSSTCGARIAPELPLHLGARSPLAFHKGLFQSLYPESPLSESDWCRLGVQSPRWHLARGGSLSSLPSSSTCRARIAPECPLHLGARSPLTFRKGLFQSLYLDSSLSESDWCRLEVQRPRWHLARGGSLSSLSSSSTCRARIAPERPLHLGARPPVTFHKRPFPQFVPGLTPCLSQTGAGWRCKVRDGS